MADTDTPSRQVLDETPTRALKFLSTLSTHVPIRGALSQRGYDDADNDEGWSLLLTVAGYRRPSPGAPAPATNAAVRDAIVALDAWDEPNLRVLRAALEHRHPEQFAFLLEGLSAAQGAASVLVVATLLDRLDALESGDDRKKSRKADHAALALLAKRGVTPEERARLRALVDTVRAAEGTAPAEPQLVPAAPASDADGVALYRWYREWSETARAVIKRRDHLILLGLAKRKAPKAKAAKSSTSDA